MEYASKKIIADVGFFFGTLGDNFTEFPKVQHLVSGLKVYLNQTTGNYKVDTHVFQNICDAWPTKKPMFVHAEADMLRDVLNTSIQHQNKLHVCHVSSQIELEQIINAKFKNPYITCGVTPHHLFLTDKDAKTLGPFGLMKPPIQSQKDRDFLWQHLFDIDCIESDHAPHTKTSKESSNPPYGVPGLETTLPLLLTALSKGNITLNQIIRMCHDNPLKILQLQKPDTHIEVDENKEWVFQNEHVVSKSHWSPFHSWHMIGKVMNVTIRDTKVYENETFFVNDGFGKIITWE